VWGKDTVLDCESGSWEGVRASESGCDCERVRVTDTGGCGGGMVGGGGSFKSGGSTSEGGGRGTAGRLPRSVPEEKLEVRVGGAVVGVAEVVAGVMVVVA